MGVLIAIPLAQGLDMSTLIPALPSWLSHTAGIIAFCWLFTTFFNKGSRVN